MKARNLPRTELYFAVAGSLLLHLALFVVFDFNIGSHTEPPQPLSLELRLQVTGPGLDSSTVDPSSETPQEQTEPVSEELSSEAPTDATEFEDAIESPVVSPTEPLREEHSAPSVDESDIQPPKTRPPLLAEMVKSVADLAGATERRSSPRIRRLFEGTDKSAEERYYMDAWLRKIQRIGQLNYPQQAIKQKLYGQLTIYVAINPDGSMHESKILESSGHEILDSAALRIVDLASPFAPFTASMREDADLLEIVKVWEFRRGEDSP